MNQIEYTSKINDELKDTIIKSLEAIDNHKSDPKYYYETLWDLMNQNSNIKEKFICATLSKDIFQINLSSILRKIKNNNEMDIADDFLVEVNNLYNIYKKYDKEEVNIILYTNIPIKFKNNTKLIETLKYFNLEIFEFEKYNFEKENFQDENMKYKFNSNNIMLKYSNFARDYEFVKTEALNNIYSFFGYITYIHKYNCDTEKWHINEITLDHKITDLQINALIGTNSNFEIYCMDRQYDVIDTAIKMGKSKIIKFDNRMPMEYTFLKSIFESNNKELYGEIKKYLCLYYIASFENIIENSFLKFWSLSERLIKDIHGGMKYNKLTKYMEKILEICNYPDKIIQRAFFIKNKRNNLVHENIHGQITQSDQAIAKIITENLILLLIHYFNYVSEIEDYKSFYYLSN